MGSLQLRFEKQMRESFGLGLQTEASVRGFRA